MKAFTIEDDNSTVFIVLDNVESIVIDKNTAHAKVAYISGEKHIFTDEQAVQLVDVLNKLAANGLI